jgi:hypothetical protein
VRATGVGNPVCTDLEGEMDPDPLDDLIKEWAYHAESEMRVHCGLPREGRDGANALVHNTLLAFFDEAIQREDFDALVAGRREELRRMKEET